MIQRDTSREGIIRRRFSPIPPFVFMMILQPILWYVSAPGTDLVFQGALIAEKTKSRSKQKGKEKERKLRPGQNGRKSGWDNSGGAAKYKKRRRKKRSVSWSITRKKRDKKSAGSRRRGKSSSLAPTNLTVHKRDRRKGGDGGGGEKVHQGFFLVLRSLRGNSDEDKNISQSTKFFK